MNKPIIYYVSLSEISDQEFFHYYHTNLTEEDRVMTDRFSMKRLKEYVVGRALLKSALKLEVGLDIHLLKLGKNHYGKPFLEEFEGIHFNLSHSEDLIMVILSDTSPVGVDVEFARKDYLDVMDEVFSLEERKHIQSLSNEEEKILSFFKLWTKKEAIMKADGRGFSYPLKSLEFSSIDDTNGFINGWWFRTFTLEEDYVVSIASKHSCRTPCIRKLAFNSTIEN
ncbi:4'-phosphopantetheinyl transferase [Bacillus pakistanensis]|uniref:4'-phosphopantetheinyl transferase n=1 Tax=Rossellomorea pakistanensis TaxID=992288 RepID=A0ABS2NE64_9BACI|nr:4'-phosphopantetheinyl transferase superfamily protein [Bacillus pakistanensis]MBM7586119.1 4'-phosphopantetheinyl transferase [Bacillus pakistanensis]